MNVTVENLSGCKKLLRVEVDVQEVEAAFEAVTKNFQREVAVPGFRPGKAPRDLVVRLYEKKIGEEVKRKLTSENYQKAVKDQHLNVLNIHDVEDIQFGRGQPMQFAATIEIAPEFELPEYRGLPAVRELSGVTEADVERALEVLRHQQAKFEPVDRPLQASDVAVINYLGACDGKPITELVPASRVVGEKKGAWVRMEQGEFITGFTEQLMGAKAGDHRTVTVDFPADFVAPELAGKKGVYEVDITEVRQKVLPPLDDAFAKSYEAENLEALRAGVRRDLQNELNYKKNKSLRSQVVQALLARVNFELPESAVSAETRSVVYDIVYDQQKRGMNQAAIEQQKDKIYSVAYNSAKERVKAAFLYQRIAAKENIKVSDEEFSRYIYVLAAQNNVTPEKFVKELKKNNALPDVHNQVLGDKVIDFLVAHAQVTDIPPQGAPA